MNRIAFNMRDLFLGLSSTTMFVGNKPNIPLTLLLMVSPLLALAHDHHSSEEIPAENDQQPIDSILWIHIFLQAFVWGVLFPIGMVLGLSKSRWHVPLQVCDIQRTLSSVIYWFRLSIRLLGSS